VSNGCPTAPSNAVSRRRPTGERSAARFRILRRGERAILARTAGGRTVGASNAASPRIAAARTDASSSKLLQTRRGRWIISRLTSESSPAIAIARGPWMSALAPQIPAIALLKTELSTGQALGEAGDFSLWQKRQAYSICLTRRLRRTQRRPFRPAEQPRRISSLAECGVGLVEPRQPAHRVLLSAIVASLRTENARSWRIWRW